MKKTKEANGEKNYNYEKRAREIEKQKRKKRSLRRNKLKIIQKIQKM